MGFVLGFKPGVEASRTSVNRSFAYLPLQVRRGSCQRVNAFEHGLETLG